MPKLKELSDTEEQAKLQKSWKDVIVHACGFPFMFILCLCLSSIVFYSSRDIFSVITLLVPLKIKHTIQRQYLDEFL